MQLVSEIIPAVAALAPDAIAVADGPMKATYANLDHRSRALAGSLRKLGIVRGSPVGILLPNGLDFVVSFFGILQTGGIAVPLNDHYQENEIRYFMEDCGISTLLTSRACGPLLQRVRDRAGHPMEVLFMDEWLPSGRADPVVEQAEPDQPVMYQFSSGSTGRPKRIARSHRKLLFELESFRNTLRIVPEDRFLGVAPFSHVNGLMRSMMASLHAGASLYPLPRFDRQRVAETVQENRLTVFIAVPFMFGMLAKSRFPTKPDFTSLRLCVSASAPMPEGVNREFMLAFGQYVRQLYGSTETGTISVNRESDISASLDSVGTPIEGVEVEVLQEDGGRTPVGELGELAVRSPAMIDRYEDLDEVNREVFRDGFFYTGDLGKKDHAGLIFLLGRKKFFINKGGYKINPQEIEQLLETHPAIEEAAVVGVPTMFDDEKVKAVVVARRVLEPDEVIDFCVGKIADFKIPSVVEFRESLPKSPTGKIRKKLLL